MKEMAAITEKPIRTSLTQRSLYVSEWCHRHLQRRQVAAREVVGRSKFEEPDEVLKRTAGESCGSFDQSFWKPLASPGNSRKSRRFCNRQM
jgi:hypothetical protein